MNKTETANEKEIIKLQDNMKMLDIAKYLLSKGEVDKAYEVLGRRWNMEDNSESIGHVAFIVVISISLIGSIMVFVVGAIHLFGLIK